MDAGNRYTGMQRQQYEHDYVPWSVNFRDPGVGSFEGHNAWSDYDEYLFKDIETEGKKGLDFACGPGRNIVKFNDRFGVIDGCDISSVAIAKAREWITHNSKVLGELYVLNGVELNGVESDTYDVVFITLALQHICVHDIRFNLMKEFHRVLKEGGTFTAQMGYDPSGKTNYHDYHKNFYEATVTNGGNDVAVSSPDQLKNDLEKIGFKNFRYHIRPVGPGDSHENWIFFNAEK